MIKLQLFMYLLHAKIIYNAKFSSGYSSKTIILTLPQSSSNTSSLKKGAGNSTKAFIDAMKTVKTSHNLQRNAWKIYEDDKLIIHLNPKGAHLLCPLDYILHGFTFSFSPNSIGLPTIPDIFLLLTLFSFKKAK